MYPTHPNSLPRPAEPHHRVSDWVYADDDPSMVKKSACQRLFWNLVHRHRHVATTDPQWMSAFLDLTPACDRYVDLSRERADLQEPIERSELTILPRFYGDAPSLDVRTKMIRGCPWSWQLLSMWANRPRTSSIE